VKRRGFLKWLGLSPAAVAVAKALPAEAAPKFPPVLLQDPPADLPLKSWASYEQTMCSFTTLTSDITLVDFSARDFVTKR
jgi:hypothetical protein